MGSNIEDSFQQDSISSTKSQILNEDVSSNKIFYEDTDTSKIIYIENTKEFRRWSILYPLYFDSRRSIKAGRKVPISKAVTNPLANIMANGAKVLGFSCIFEPNKTHPKDWANPGRIRILFKENGIPSHVSLKTKKALYLALSSYLQANPTTKMSPMKVPVSGFNKPPSLPDIPKGILMGDILPLNSPALVSDEFLENFSKDMTKEQKCNINRSKQKKEKKKKN
ncbi:hypothetical protein PNEG_00653 [Pneumocystis murina B123]|uniref:Signal recognition particle, SRP19 subunit n=1 Tax=Pneumocystis murina (strain B123) TaxID=1069680 RepID=M7PB00_PNEMU|nr:hypothetical protein PNEG_00653 [Pneumocystis murina B123]EMR11055.1 hypothetical protein PNEG_00653 [Pneumocystis murina B123]